MAEGDADFEGGLTHFHIMTKPFKVTRTYLVWARNHDEAKHIPQPVAPLVVITELNPADIFPEIGELEK